MIDLLIYIIVVVVQWELINAGLTALLSQAFNIKIKGENSENR